MSLKNKTILITGGTGSFGNAFLDYLLKYDCKINILSSLSEKSENLVIIGAMANNFLKFKGINIGASLIEKGAENNVKNIYSMAEKNKCKIIIPLDCNTSTSLNGNPLYKSLQDISSKDIILDIGKKTIDLINKTIDNSNTVFWNGPAGYYENKNFSKGSLCIAKKISENTSPIKLESIQFCHTETAKLEVEEKVAKDGYCIVPIENCPDPY